MVVLYNYFDTYDVVKRNGGSQLSHYDRNQISVCSLIKYDNQKMLFTGDLEEAGEKELIKNHSDLIRNVTFFKAGHHGSYTSNTEEFVDVIRPSYVSITKMSRSDYPDDAISRFLKYTDYIYPTYVEYNNQFSALFGDEVFTFDGQNVSTYTSENDGISSLREAIITNGYSNESWFEYRLNDASGTMLDVLSVISFDEELPSYNNCTLVKYGHYDILIDCGSTANKSVEFVEKLKSYVVDGVLEYVIVTHFHSENISQLIGTYENNQAQKNGVFHTFVIDNLIDSNVTTIPKNLNYGYYSRYLNIIEQCGIKQHKCLKRGETETISISDELNMRLVASNGSNEDEDNCSMAALVTYRDHKLLFVGDLYDYRNLDEIIKGVDFLRPSNSSVSVSCLNERFNYSGYLKKMNAKYAVVGTPVNYRMPHGAIFGGNDYHDALSKSCKKLYFIGYIDSQNEYIPDNGTIIFSLNYHKNGMSKKIVAERTSKEPSRW